MRNTFHQGLGQDFRIGRPEPFVTAGAASLFVLGRTGLLERVPALPLSDPKLEPATAAGSNPSVITADT